jgi:hypothetical protein
MAVGDTAKISDQSYVAYGKETAFGTYASATTAVEVLSCSFRVDIESEKLPTLHRNRGMNKRVQTLQNVGGTAYLHPAESVLLVATALGGGITSATVTSTGGFTHSIAAGNFDTTTASLSFNVRKGDAHTWRYVGGRPNVLTISGSVGEAVKITAEMVFKDATQQSDDIANSITVSALLPFVYHQGSYQYNSVEGSLTSTVAEPIQSFELVISNNIVSDAAARQLGSMTPAVLPATTRDVQLTITQRWDTTTNYARFIQATMGAAQLVFTGAQIVSGVNYKATFVMPKLYMNSPDPEIGGPGEVLQSEITFDVLVSDDNTTTGKDIGVTFVNNTASY